ncbi:hypothetical protein [Jeotgalibacillus marinus]|uniref:Uncharacterized protein n=1 Tax=Jeotgalibacillus marinus TaxID=86667 RepID=A0ABV3Q5Q9_9BACL
MILFVAIRKGGVNIEKVSCFIISFALLNTVFQVLSGLVLTAYYVPDIPDFSSMNSNLSQEVVFGVSSIIPFPLLSTLITATLAYFFSQKFFITPQTKSNE